MTFNLSYRFFAIYYFSLFFLLLCGIVNISVRLGLWLSVEFVGGTFSFSLAWLVMSN